MESLLSPFALTHNLTFEIIRAGQGGTKLESEKARGPSKYGTLTVETLDSCLEAAPISDPASNAFKMLSNTIFANWDLLVLPGIMTANTDTRHYWGLTKNIFRFSPHAKVKRYIEIVD